MNASDGARRRFRPSRRLSLIGIVLIVITVAAAGVAIWDHREEALAHSRREMTNLGVVLAEQNARAIQAVDLVLQTTQRMVLAAGVSTPEQFTELMGTEEVHGFLARRLGSLPQADALSLINTSGRIVNFSRGWPPMEINTADRDFYAYFRDHQDPEVFIGKPVINKVTGAWVVTLTRRVSGPRGEFLGIVLGVVETRYFEEFYQTVTAAEGQSVALFRRDGILLARHPHAEASIGQRLPSEAPWYALVAKGGGTYRSPGYVDSVPRIVSVQPVRDFPLAVAVTVAESSVLAEWRRQSTFIALAALCTAIGFARLFRMLAAQSARLEEQSAELERAAEGLRESEARFRDFALTSSDWLWETDAQHRFTYHSENICAFGQDPSNRLGRTRLELAVDADTDPAKWAEHRAILDGHEPFRNFVYRRKVGTDPEGYISVSGKPIFAHSGRFLGYRGTVRDITRETIAERNLVAAKTAAEAANLAKSQFLANMSHELRTPLNAILGFSEMLYRGLTGPLQPRQSEYAGLIHESGQHLLNVINDILDLARVDAGKFELHEESGIDPRRLVESSIALVTARAESGMLTLDVEFDEQIPLLVVDPTRITQILLNLLSNAIKFTEPGGSVTLTLRSSPDGGVEFAVSDTGPGMTAAEIEIALEPFGQIDPSHTRQHEGTGLGLPMARRLAELHGGSLHIDSEKGRGTRVAVTLPAARVYGPAAWSSDPVGVVVPATHSTSPISFDDQALENRTSSTPIPA